ncbi:MAG: nucleotidyltransferase family protein, partial [Clostridia bacterium]|nr:nucleotidyltransferase family protein [Clostridia bacterium]
MRGVCAVICEFDPLHPGHKKVIDHAKSSSDVLIAVLGGSFTQRSIPALFDKYTRARAALRCGFDLVIELPFPWSCSGVEYYAFGGVSTALALGANSICFGSELGDINELIKAAEYSTSPEFVKTAGNVSSDLKIGAAVAFDSAFRQGGFQLGKNDKLAVEYIKAVLRSGRNDVSFSTVRRDESITCASKIRELIAESGLKEAKALIVPEAYEVFLSGSAVVSSGDKLELFEFMYFRFFEDEDFDRIFEASGGVGNRLRKAAVMSREHSDFFSLASTKKYTDSRLRRAALCSILGVTKNDLAAPPSFTHLLAANDTGRDYLSELNDAEIRVITKPSDVPESRQIALERKADELYSLCSDPPAAKGRFVKSTPY